MRDIMSLIAASSLLALGGLGLYVYKSNNSTDDDNSDDENEHRNFLRDDDNDAIKLTRDEDDYSEEDVPKLIETKPKRNKSTKSKRRLTGTRRR